MTRHLKLVAHTKFRYVTNVQVISAEKVIGVAACIDGKYVTRRFAISRDPQERSRAKLTFDPSASWIPLPMGRGCRLHYTKFTILGK